jgi:methylmalonyl-CoA carboxyltransferase large subunit
MRNHDAVIDTQETTVSGVVPNSDTADLRATLEQILEQLENLSRRVAGLEQLASMGGAEAVPAATLPQRTVHIPEAPKEPSSVVAAAGISEEELLAISAALAAWLGVQAHIRQIRLIRTGAWAQQGRVTIQASHLLQH